MCLRLKMAAPDVARAALDLRFPSNTSAGREAKQRLHVWEFRTPDEIKQAWPANDANSAP
jgi:hypothetical protein